MYEFLHMHNCQLIILLIISPLVNVSRVMNFITRKQGGNGVKKKVENERGKMEKGEGEEGNGIKWRIVFKNPNETF